MSKIFVFLVMFCFSCSVSFADRPWLYPPSKEAVKQYAEQYRNKKIEHKKLEKLAPPLSLIKTMIERCKLDEMKNSIEVYDSSLKVNFGELYLPSTQAEILNGFEIGGRYDYKYTSRTIRPEYDHDWGTISDSFYFKKSNGIVSIDDSGFILDKCHTTIDMNGSEPEIICKSDCERKKSEDLEVHNRDYNICKDAFSRSKPDITDSTAFHRFMSPCMSNPAEYQAR
jgi:hypothetical protein